LVVLKYKLKYYFHSFVTKHIISNINHTGLRVT